MHPRPRALHLVLVALAAAVSRGSEPATLTPQPQQVQPAPQTPAVAETVGVTLVEVAGDVPTLDLDPKEKRYQQDFTVLVLVRDAGGKVVRKLSRRFVTGGPLEKAEEARRGRILVPRETWLPPGRYSVEAAVQDAASGRLDVQRTPLEKAHRALRSAVAADPSHFEARLRLDDAARRYEAALALEAQAQSARLALSHVRLRLEDAAAARREVETAVGATGRRPKPDPFWLYPWGPSAGVEERLEALRREVSP